MPDYSRDAFAHEGTMQVRPLGRKGLARPIAAGECAITALIRGPEGRIYGATSGRRAHLFRYDPSPMVDCVMDNGAVGDEREVSGLVVHGKLLFGATGEAAGAGGYLFRYDTARDGAHDYGYGRGPVEMLCQPLEGEPIAGIILDPTRERIYGIGAKSGTFFVYDITANVVTKVGAATEAGVVSAPLILTSDAVYGVVEEGRVFRYDLAAASLERLDLFIPCLAGLELYNRLQALAVDPVTRVVYGGTHDGLLFAMNPDDLSFVTLGKPVAQPGMRALTVALDGRVYGLGGNKGGMAHLFRYDPETRDLRDLGIPRASSERYWHGYEFGAAVTGRFGEIYFGEADRISHLWIYHPPVKRRAGP